MTVEVLLVTVLPNASCISTAGVGSTATPALTVVSGDEVKTSAAGSAGATRNWLVCAVNPFRANATIVYRPALIVTADEKFAMGAVTLSGADVTICSTESVPPLAPII